MGSEAPDLGTVTTRQRAAWSAGEFNRVALTTMEVAEHLVATADPGPGSRVLDVACGTGNAALVAARRFTEVVGLDFAPNLLAAARRRAAAEGTDIALVEGDAQALPFEDASFDTVLSVFGVMFAPDQERAAAELLRVTRPGGTIALANWVPGSSADAFFRMSAQLAPPPPGLMPHGRRGTEEGAGELLGGGATVELHPRTFHQPLPLPRGDDRHLQGGSGRPCSPTRRPALTARRRWTPRCSRWPPATTARPTAPAPFRATTSR